MAVDNRSLDAAARRIGDRWTLRIVGALLDADRTFGELSADVEGIAPTILTARLRTLQRLGLVVAEPYERRPPRMRYALTQSGRDLAMSIASLAAWGAGHEGRRSSQVHGTCGTPVEPRLWCPTCEQVVAEHHGPHQHDDDVDELIWC